MNGVFQEDQNRGKPNWEHLNDDLHVLITCEDAENRAQMKISRAVDEVKKLLTVVSQPAFQYFCSAIIYYRTKIVIMVVVLSSLSTV